MSSIEQNKLQKASERFNHIEQFYCEELHEPLDAEWLHYRGFDWDRITYTKESIMVSPTPTDKGGFSYWPKGLSGGERIAILDKHHLEEIIYLSEIK